MAEKTYIEKARLSAGISPGRASEIIGVSVPTYYKKERNPRLMTFGEFESLGMEMDDESRAILWKALEEVGNEVFEDRPLNSITLDEYYRALNSGPRLQGDLFALQAKFFAR